MESVRPLLSVFAAVMALSAPVRAQGSGPSDSILVQQIGAAVIKELAFEISRAAVAGERAVVISVPSGSTWAPFAQHLLRSLNGRPPVDTDAHKLTVEVGRPIVRRDSVTVSIRIGGEWKCRGAWTGASTIYRATTVLFGNTWVLANMETVLFTDSVPCSAPDA